jgi:stromal membrane-associated protein
MGTHISRVKSVDLDSWTDEQLQSILSWGNARANKYWEAKLATGHVPSEAKIENFIRTKYELKRWVMDGPMPDPSTLGADGDDDVPLSIVKEKQTIDRKESIRKASVGKSAAPQADLIGGDPIPQRSSTAGPTTTKVAPKGQPAPPKATNTKDSLLGLDFLGGEPAAPPRPASTTGTPGMGGQSRPDLKQSILSLYASAPKPQPQQQPSHTPSGSFGMPSPTMPQSQPASGGLADAFSGLSFGGPPAVKSPQPSAFSNLGAPASTKRSTPAMTSPAFSNLSGGSFFDAKPTAAAPTHQQKQSFGGSDGFGGATTSGFGGLTSSTVSAPVPKPGPAPAPALSALGDMFDFGAPAPVAAPAPSDPPAPAPVNNVFNLSANQPKQTTPAAAPASTLSTSTWSNSDIWGDNAWGAPSSTSTTAKSPELPKTSTMGGTIGGTTGSTNDFGWGSSNTGSLANQSIIPGSGGGFSPTGPPKVAADEEFGGWTSSGGGGNSAAKPAGGLGNNDDLFSNVWQ